MESARLGDVIRIKPIHDALEDCIQVRLKAGILRSSAPISDHVQQPDKYRRTIMFILL